MKPKKIFSENGEPPPSSIQPKWHHKIGYWGKKIWNHPVWSGVIASFIWAILSILSTNKIALVVAAILVITALVIYIITRGRSPQKIAQNKATQRKKWKEIIVVISFLVLIALIAQFLGYSPDKTLQNNAKSYTIYFYDETGVAREKNYTKDTTPLALDPIQKDGYIFDGWYDNEDKIGEATPEIPKGSKGNKMFWGNWILEEYLVTFFTDGGSPIPPDTSYTIKSEDLFLPKELTKSGYVFKGWTLGLGTLTVDRIPKGSKGHKKFWALWEKNPSLHTEGDVGVQKPSRNPCIVTVLKSGYGSKERAIRFATQEAEEKFRNMYPNISYAIDEPITRQEGINWEAEVTVREINR